MTQMEAPKEFKTELQRKVYEVLNEMSVPFERVDTDEAITMELSAYQLPRPQWDVQLLVEAGFERICVDVGVYRRIYAELDEFYNPTPIFTIAAYK